jgi:hypothetical protein
MWRVGAGDFASMRVGLKGTIAALEPTAAPTVERGWVGPGPLAPPIWERPAGPPAGIENSLHSRASHPKRPPNHTEEARRTTRKSPAEQL